MRFSALLRITAPYRKTRGIQNGRESNEILRFAQNDGTVQKGKGIQKGKTSDEILRFTQNDSSVQKDKGHSEWQGKQ